MIIDGDGIIGVSQNLNIICRRKGNIILTPHPGEMPRIAAKMVSEILLYPITTLQQTAQDLNASIVLKAADSLIGYPDGRVFINLIGLIGR